MASQPHSSKSSRRPRSFPLVPKPLSRGRLGLGTAKNPYMVEVNGSRRQPRPFEPTVDAARYETEARSSSQEADDVSQYFIQLEHRAKDLASKAALGTLRTISESSWESNYNSLAFKCVGDDEDHFHMDKRRYQFPRTNAHGNPTVEDKIVDWTIGVRTFSREEGAQDIGNLPQCLDKDFLTAQMNDRRFGLVVDGKWGEANLIFPWAVWEAKRAMREVENGLEEGRKQVYHAARVYLGMYDDLLRDPADPSKYLEDNGYNCQMFCFVSCGATWEVFLARNIQGRCDMERLWTGDVTILEHARNLLCIVDQVHKDAQRSHYRRVVKHLTAWLDRFTKETAQEIPEPRSEWTSQAEWWIMKNVTSNISNMKMPKLWRKDVSNQQRRTRVPPRQKRSRPRRVALERRTMTRSNEETRVKKRSTRLILDSQSSVQSIEFG